VKDTCDSDQLAVRLAFKQLIHPEGMGETFKVLVQAKGVGGGTLSGLAPL
jgi:SAM-dependent MidA family methyltransferase